MPRPKRIIAANSYYHVYNRANNRRSIHLSEQTFDFFLNLLSHLKEKFDIHIFAYCLMKNHYHIMLQTKKPNLHHAMKYFGEHYGFFINKSLNSSVPVFNTRYQSKYIHDDRYLLQVLRYIHLNPVEANLIKNYKEYVWSSIHDYLEERFDIINTSIMKKKFLNKDDFLAYHELGNSKELNFFYNRKKSPGILSLNNVEKINKNKKT